MISTRRLALPALAALALGLGACGAGPEDPTDPGAETDEAGRATEEPAQSPDGVPIDAYTGIDDAFAVDGSQLSAEEVADLADQVEALAPGTAITEIRRATAVWSVETGRIDADWEIESESDGDRHSFAVVDGEVLSTGSHEVDAHPETPTPPAPEVPVADLVATALDEHPGDVLTVELPLLTDRPVIAMAIRAEDGSDVRVTLDSTTGEIIDAIDPADSPMRATGRDDGIPDGSALGLPAEAFAEFDEWCTSSYGGPPRRDAILMEQEAVEGDDVAYLVEQAPRSPGGSGTPVLFMRLVDDESVVDQELYGEGSERTSFTDMPDDERAAYEGWSVPIAESWLAAIEARPGEVSMFAVPDGAEHPMTTFCIVRGDLTHDRVTVDGVTGEVLAATEVAAETQN